MSEKNVKAIFANNITPICSIIIINYNVPNQKIAELSDIVILIICFICLYMPFGIMVPKHPL